MTPQPVKFFGVDRQFQRNRETLLDLTARALESGHILQGPDVHAFEHEVASVCRRRHAVAVGSCTDALAFALLAHDIGPGDEVLVPSLSFFASVSGVLRVGATPRFVDIDPHYALMDPAHAASLIGPRTRAILAVHLYGQTLPFAPWEKLAADHDLLLIEDAAQALGAFDHHRPAGSLGQVSCLSFDPTKVINAYSSAGALLTDDPALAERVRRLRYHGRDPHTKRFVEVGYNSQLASDKAAQLRFQLSQLMIWTAERSAIAQRYQAGLRPLPCLRLPAIRPGSTHNWHKYVLRFPGGRDTVAARLRQAGIETMIHYPLPLCDEPAVTGLSLPPASTAIPQARAWCAECLSLPIYPELTDAEVELVIAAVHASTRDLEPVTDTRPPFAKRAEATPVLAAGPAL